MPYGYNGKILHVDLTASRLKVEEPGEAFYRKYLGGSALGMYYALKLIPPGADPLGPENVLVLSLGVTTGAPISGQSRVTATAKSPLSGAIGDAQAGGFWPAEAKSAGFDAFVIRGKADKPVYLWVQDGQAELRDAAHLWGAFRATGEVQAAIQEELGDSKIEVLQCGPAGERGVRFACLINMSNRANGRTGMGAVMGSKNLKAIAVQGEKRRGLQDEAARALVRDYIAKIRAAPRYETYARFSNSAFVTWANEAGILATRNYRQVQFEGADRIDGRRLIDYVTRSKSCYR
ncbi:MAG: aldehyde ferredoxin oxidoreductase N-terminal domain-containing protein, partial [Anaerolineae bacterium]